MAVKSFLLCFAVIIPICIGGYNWIEITKTGRKSAIVKGRVRYYFQKKESPPSVYEYVDDNQIKVFPGCKLISDTGEEFTFVGGKAFMTKWKHKSKGSIEEQPISERVANLLIEEISTDALQAGSSSKGHVVVWQVEGTFSGKQKPPVPLVKTEVMNEAPIERPRAVHAPEIIQPPISTLKIVNELIKRKEHYDTRATRWIDSYFNGPLVTYLEANFDKNIAHFLQAYIELYKEYSDYTELRTKKGTTKHKKKLTINDIVSTMGSVYDRFILHSAEEAVNIPWSYRKYFDYCARNGWRAPPGEHTGGRIVTPSHSMWQKLIGYVAGDADRQRSQIRLSDIYMKWLFDTKEGTAYSEDGAVYRERPARGDKVTRSRGFGAPVPKLIDPPKLNLVFDALCKTEFGKDDQWVDSYWYEGLRPFLLQQSGLVPVIATFLTNVIEHSKTHPDWKRKMFTVIDKYIAKVDAEQLAAFGESDIYMTWLSTPEGDLYKMNAAKTGGSATASSALGTAHEELFDLYEDEEDLNGMWIPRRKQMDNMYRNDSFLTNGLLLSFLGVLCVLFIIIFCSVYIFCLLFGIMMAKYWKETKVEAVEYSNINATEII